MYLGEKESLHAVEPIFIISLLARSFPCPHSHPSLPTAHSMDKVLHLQQMFSLLPLLTLSLQTPGESPSFPPSHPYLISSS